MLIKHWQASGRPQQVSQGNASARHRQWLQRFQAMRQRLKAGL